MLYDRIRAGFAGFFGQLYGEKNGVCKCSLLSSEYWSDISFFLSRLLLTHLLHLRVFPSFGRLINDPSMAGSVLLMPVFLGHGMARTMFVSAPRRPRNIGRMSTFLFGLPLNLVCFFPLAGSSMIALAMTGSGRVLPVGEKNSVRRCCSMSPPEYLSVVSYPIFWQGG